METESDLFLSSLEIFSKSDFSRSLDYRIPSKVEV